MDHQDKISVLLPKEGIRRYKGTEGSLCISLIIPKQWQMRACLRIKEEVLTLLNLTSYPLQMSLPATLGPPINSVPLFELGTRS